MNLSPMRFKSFIWPHNPKTYTITFERQMAVHKIPFGRHYLQSLGQTRRVLRGDLLFFLCKISDLDRFSDLNVSTVRNHLSRDHFHKS